MSALSVMSLIAPTAPVGANAETVDTAADGALFAGLVAAVAPSLKGTGEDGAPVADAAPAETDAAGTPALDIAVEAAPAWAPVPLIAPAPLPVAPATPAAPVAEGEVPASAEAPAAAPPIAPPIAPAPPLNAAADAPSTSAAPALVGEAPAAAAGALPLSSPSSDAETPASGMAKAPTTPVASIPSQAAPVEARPAQPQPAASQSTAPSTEAPPPTAQPTRQAAAARPMATTAPVAPTTPAPTSDAEDAPSAPRAEAAPVAPAASRAPTPAPIPVVMTASSTPAATPAATATRPAPAAPSALPPAAEPVAQTAPIAQAATSTPTAAPAPRPAKAVASQPAAPSASQPARLAQPVDEADAPEPVVAPAAVSSDAESEAETPLPATAATAPAPTRNGSTRLDERRSNAATASAPAEARAETRNGARSILPTSTPSVAAPAATTTAALNDAAAPAPLRPVDAAPLDAPADLAPSQPLLDAQTAAPTAQRDLGLSQLSRATVETTAHLAAQIIKKLEGRSTRFDMALTPEGLGRVDVSLEIDSDGRLAARLAFDNPAAATDMRARADELRRQLQDAGFQLTQDSLEFSDRNPSSGFNGGGAFDRAPDRRAFAGAARLAAEADSVLPPPGAWASLSLTPDRVDMKV